jgi:hypothetical protein
MQELSYEPILMTLGRLKLERLAFYDRSIQWWEDDTEDKDGFRGVPKGLLESLAKEVDVGPLNAGEEFGGSKAATTAA